MAREQEHLAKARVVSVSLWQTGLYLIRVYSCPFAVVSFICVYLRSPVLPSCPLAASKRLIV